MEIFFFEYFNPYVLFSYTCCIGVLVLNVFIYTRVDYRFGVVINSMSTVFVMLLSHIILKESITRKTHCRKYTYCLRYFGVYVFLKQDGGRYYKTDMNGGVYSLPILSYVYYTYRTVGCQ